MSACIRCPSCSLQREECMQHLPQVPPPHGSCPHWPLPLPSAQFPTRIGRANARRFTNRCFGYNHLTLPHPPDAKKLAQCHPQSSCPFAGTTPSGSSDRAAWTSLFWVSIKLARTSMSAHREFDSPLVRRFPPLHQARKTKSEPLSTGLVGD